MNNNDTLTVTNDTYSRYAPRFAERHWGADLSKGYEALAALLPADAHILEIGCGPGRDVAQLRERGYRVTGLDLSLAMLDQARDRVGGDLLAGNMLHLPFGTGFQAAWLAASLLHIPKELAPNVLRDIYRVLMPDGLVFLSLKSGDGESWLETTEGRRFFAYYQMDELRALLSAHHFAVEAAWADQVTNTEWLDVIARRVD